jgi:hypothetical protein
VLDQFKNRVSVVLCHAKVSRASRAESAYPRDEAFSGDKILPMNAFWNSFETVLGLAVEPRNLTFVQISLRGIIVFLVTLAAVRLGHKRSLSRKTPFDAVLLVILVAVLSRAIQSTIWTKRCDSAYTSTTFPGFESRAWNAAATLAS